MENGKRKTENEERMRNNGKGKISSSIFSVFHFPFSIIIALGLVGVFLLSGFTERARPPLPDGYADEDLALQGARLKGFSPGFEGLLADWYWVRSLQYIGGKVVKYNDKNENFNLENLKPLNPRLLYPLLDNAATLDPRFTAVYSYGAIVLPAIDRQQAIKLAEKGIENNPEKWRLYEQLGYIYWRLEDYEKAADVYRRGSKVEGAPTFMKVMATNMQTAGGDRATARAVYEQMLASESDKQIRNNADLQLLRLDSLDERDAIRAALQDFKEKNNRCAANWREILPILRTAKLPGNRSLHIDAANNLVDPSGAPYLLDREVCDVKLDEAKSKIPVK